MLLIFNNYYLAFAAAGQKFISKSLKTLKICANNPQTYPQPGLSMSGAGAVYEDAFKRIRILDVGDFTFARKDLVLQAGQPES